SVRSRWVVEEATAALERGVLVPVLLDQVKPPVGFLTIHAANLVDWSGTQDDPRLQQLLLWTPTETAPPHELDSPALQSDPSTGEDVGILTRVTRGQYLVLGTATAIFLGSIVAIVSKGSH